MGWWDGKGGGLLVSCGEVTLVLAEPFVVALVRGLGLGLGILPSIGDHTPFGVLLNAFHLHFASSSSNLSESFSSIIVCTFTDNLAA